jgi:hypothetical protein
MIKSPEVKIQKLSLYSCHSSFEFTQVFIFLLFLPLIEVHSVVNKKEEWKMLCYKNFKKYMKKKKNILLIYFHIKVILGLLYSKFVLLRFFSIQPHTHTHTYHNQCEISILLLIG